VVLAVLVNNKIYILKMSLLKKAENTKQAWAFSLKRGMYKDTLTCYDENFIFKGTKSKKATTDKYDLSKYFKKFSNEVNDVTFFKNNINMVKNNMVFDAGRYNFKLDNSTIKAQYFFVFDNKGKILIHYSTFYD
jgi:hypothetical protein